MKTVLVAAILLLPAAPALAATAQEFAAAYAAAEQVEHQATALQNAWTTTEATLQAANQAAAAKDYAKAVALAHHAEAMAKVSVAEAKEQKTLWRDAVVH